MKKYLEQRIEDLELEIKKLKAKDELNSIDYMYNPSVNLMSEPDLETTFPIFFDEEKIKSNPLKTVSMEETLKMDPFYFPDNFKLSSISHLDSDFPPYPNIEGSWDDKNPKDIIVDENNS